MIKTLEKSARTEDLAIAEALKELGMDRDDVSVEILERAKSGFLGIGASPAVIRVSYECPDEEPVAAPVVEEAVVEEPAAEIVDENPDYAQIRKFLTGLLELYALCCKGSKNFRIDKVISIHSTNSMIIRYGVIWWTSFNEVW